MIKVFKELKSLANKGVYNKTSIEYWLHKNKLKYKNLKSDIDALERDFPNAYIRNDDRLINEVKFLETYEVLIDVLECYKNELYFKAEIESKFRELFQNTSTFSGYEFIIRYPFDLPVKLEVNTSDFQNTIQFIEILK